MLKPNCGSRLKKLPSRERKCVSLVNSLAKQRGKYRVLIFEFYRMAVDKKLKMSEANLFCVIKG
jgi:hypothetical protein